MGWSRNEILLFAFFAEFSKGDHGAFGARGEYARRAHEFTADLLGVCRS